MSGNPGMSGTVYIPAAHNGIAVKGIAMNGFQNCAGITKVEFEPGSNLSTIDSRAFSDCSALTTVVLPSTVKSIGNGAFENCASLETFGWGGVTSVGADAFKSCSLLTTIPVSLSSVGSNAFQNCANINGVVVLNGNVGNYAFEGTAITSVQINGATVGNYAFNNCKQLTSVTLSDNVTSVGIYAFMNCMSLSSVRLSENPSFKKVDVGAFVNCTSLSEISNDPLGITLPYNIKTLANYSFKNTGFVSINFGGVKEIGTQAFSSCVALTSVVLTESVEILNNHAFSHCVNLYDVTFMRYDLNDPKPITLCDGDMFVGIYHTINVHTPVGAKQAYYNAWYDSANTHRWLHFV